MRTSYGGKIYKYVHCRGLADECAWVFVVLGWWATSIVRLMPRQLDLARQAIPVRAIAAALMIVLAVALAGTSSDQRNPALYGLRSWATYPSILMRPFRHLDGCIKMDCVANKPDQRDVALIRARTRPGEQVAIVGDLFDWTYLIDAHRPPYDRIPAVARCFHATPTR